MAFNRDMRWLSRISPIFVLILVASCGGSSSPTTPTGPEPAPTPAPAPTPTAVTARYRVTFDATWSAATHPVEIPGFPHFSPLIGATHSDRVVFWEPGGEATPGIEAMAELGATSPLDAEIRAAIAAGTAQRLIVGEGVSPSPDRVSVEFEIGRNFPLVTLVSMIAPSPDWFVGVHGLSLVEGGDWVASKTAELRPYDAGTDSGATFRSADTDTMPRQPIREIQNPPLSAGGPAEPLGTFTFERLSS